MTDINVLFPCLRNGQLTGCCSMSIALRMINNLSGHNVNIPYLAYQRIPQNIRKESLCMKKPVCVDAED